MTSDPDLHLDRKIFGPGIIILCAKFNKILSGYPADEHIRALLGQETKMDQVVDEYAESLLEYLGRLSDPAMQNARQCLEDPASHEHGEAVYQEASYAFGRVMKILGHAVTQGMISPRVAQLAMEKYTIHCKENS